MKGPLAYIGGKTRLANDIIALIPEHITYVEPFAGGAQVFFRKERSKVEVLNDRDGELVNFYRVCQLHHEELIRHFRFILVSRAWHGLLKQSNPALLTDVQRAVRYLYLLRNSYAALVRRLDYSIKVVQKPGFNPDRLAEQIEQSHARLARVQIESLPYEEILKRYDRSTTFFYLDPPYYALQLYRFNFKHEDFVALATRLKTLKGKFILSLNDTPEVRELFADFTIREVNIAYTAQHIEGRRYREVLITNF